MWKICQLWAQMGPERLGWDGGVGLLWGWAAVAGFLPPCNLGSLWRCLRPGKPILLWLQL